MGKARKNNSVMRLIRVFFCANSMVRGCTMKPFQFEDALSVGNDHIDSQHRALIRRFARLGVCRPADFNREQPVQSVISDLIIAVTRHFIDEEELLVRNGYPAYEAHAREHAEFVEALSQTLQMDDDEILRLRLPSLTEHLIAHLKTQDITSRPYLVVNS